MFEDCEKKKSEKNVDPKLEGGGLVAGPLKKIFVCGFPYSYVSMHIAYPLSTIIIRIADPGGL